MKRVNHFCERYIHVDYRDKVCIVMSLFKNQNQSYMLLIVMVGSEIMDLPLCLLVMTCYLLIIYMQTVGTNGLMPIPHNIVRCPLARHYILCMTEKLLTGT